MYKLCLLLIRQRRSLQENNLWGEDHEHWMIFESRCILWLNWSSIDKLSLDTSTTSCSAQCGRWKAAFTRRCPPTLALWQGGVVIVIVIVIVNDIIYEKMSNSIPIHHQEFLRETVTICQDGVADLLRLGELVQQYQAAGWKDHQVGRSLLTSFTSFTFLSSHHWQL